MEVCTIDLETTMRNVGEESVGKMKSSPFYRENEIVAHGINLFNTTSTWYMKDPPYNDILDNSGVLVAHNMQFDLKYLLRDHNELFLDWLRDGKLWCTMVAEYVLSGMTHKFPSLNELSEKYGGTQKKDQIKEYWNAGFDTDEIPEDELIEYLEYDVNNTKIVYDGQVALAKKLGMLPVIELHMEMLIGIILMEFNGCKFDIQYSREESKRLTELYETNYTILMNKFREFFIEDTWEKLNPESGDQLSLVLFGGQYTHDGYEQVMNDDGSPYLFKSGLKKGQIKMKRVKIVKEMTGLGLQPDPKWELKKEGFYSTDEETIKTLLIGATGSHKQFLEAVLLSRTLLKDNSTYHQGFSSLVYEDGYIHHNLNTSKTNTARLSSSAPNMQNLSGE